MKDRTYHIKAFSILEVSFVMAIIAIIITVVFSLIQVFYRGYSDFDKYNQYLTDLNKFSYLIHKQLHESQNLSLRDQTLIFEKEKSKVVLEQFPDYVLIKKDQLRDTLFLQFETILLKRVFDQKKERFFDQLIFNFKNDNLGSLNYYKRVYADQILNQDMF